MTIKEILDYLEPFASDKNLAGMARFGIEPKNGLGISMPPIRELAKINKNNDSLSDELWASDIHELKILAILIRNKNRYTPKLANLWVTELYSWDICDQFCMKLIAHLDFADDLINQWVADDREFVKRAGFAAIASSTMHRKMLNDSIFIEYLNICKMNVTDNRNYVKKAVNWAIRQIGKKNIKLRDEALNTCEEILEYYNGYPSARWIANDAVRELNSPEIISRVNKKADKNSRVKN